MWSYPIIKNGLIYVIDDRNGLVICVKTGPHANELMKFNSLKATRTSAMPPS
jgi:hypothetical protein